MERYIWIAVALLVFVGFWWMRRPSVTSEEARRLVAEGSRLIDVRSPSEFASGHLPGAVNIPVDQIGARTGEAGPKDRPVVLYCASGMRSASAARTLRAAGFSDVRNLGSMSNW